MFLVSDFMTCDSEVLLLRNFVVTSAKLGLRFAFLFGISNAFICAVLPFETA